MPQPYWKVRKIATIAGKVANLKRLAYIQFGLLQKTTVLSNSTTPALLNSAALSNLTAFVLLNVAEFDSAFTTENTKIKNGVPKRLKIFLAYLKLG